MAEYLHASGGQANSRNVGRYLAANKGSSGRGTTALSELKERYGSLNTFIKGIPNFYIVHGPPESKEFDVRIGEELMMEQNLRWQWKNGASHTSNVFGTRARLLGVVLTEKEIRDAPSRICRTQFQIYAPGYVYAENHQLNPDFQSCHKKN